MLRKPVLSDATTWFLLKAQGRIPNMRKQTRNVCPKFKRPWNHMLNEFYWFLFRLNSWECCWKKFRRKTVWKIQKNFFYRKNCSSTSWKLSPFHFVKTLAGNIFPSGTRTSESCKKKLSLPIRVWIKMELHTFILSTAKWWKEIENKNVVRGERPRPLFISELHFIVSFISDKFWSSQTAVINFAVIRGNETNTF